MATPSSQAPVKKLLADGEFPANNIPITKLDDLSGFWSGLRHSWPGCLKFQAFNRDESIMVALSQTGALSKAVNAPPAAQGRRTLLIVDDDEGPRQSLRMVFKDDYNILLAEGGSTALDLARQHTIDTAIVDIRMAGMSGIEVLSSLKQIDPAIEVIMLTGYVTIETAQQALRLGACDYLSKPFDVSTIRTIVANAMDQRSLSEQIRANNRKLHELQDEIKNRRLQEEIARARGEIYASIIHDINGPLTVISGFIEMINQVVCRTTNVGGSDLDLVKDRLARITRQVSNCIDISRRYLSFLQKGPVTTTPISVNQTLKDLADLLRFHPSSKSNELIIEPLAKDAQVEINGTDLIQVLLNLAINAFQCTPSPHQVKVQGRVLSRAIDLAAIREGPAERLINRAGFNNTGHSVAISVQDNGPGIPPAVIEKIFDPYFTTKAENQGSGLGLAIVHRLMKEAKGMIHVHTQADNGANFTIYLPARKKN